MLAVRSIFCQVTMQPGLYKVTLNIQGVGYCYMKQDSSFVFCRTKRINSAKRNENSWKEFDDSISGAGIGRWHIEDSFLILSFKNMAVKPLRYTKLKYTSKTGQPHDSLFINLKVSMTGKKKSIPFLLSLPAFFTTVKETPVKIVIPYTPADTVLTIHLTDEYKFPLYLNRENNIHDIQIDFPDQETRFATIENTNCFFSFNMNGNIFKHRFFQKEDAGIEKIQAILQKNSIWFPERKNVYSYLLSKIKE